MRKSQNLSCGQIRYTKKEKKRETKNARCPGSFSDIKLHAHGMAARPTKLEGTPLSRHSYIPLPPLHHDAKNIKKRNHCIGWTGSWNTSIHQTLGVATPDMEK